MSLWDLVNHARQEDTLMITSVNSTNINAKAAGGHHGGGLFLKADCGECSSPEVLLEA